MINSITQVIYIHIYFSVLDVSSTVEGVLKSLITNVDLFISLFVFTSDGEADGYLAAVPPPEKAQSQESNRDLRLTK